MTRESDIAFAYGDGEIFDDDPEAKAQLAQLSFLGPMVPFLFHDACGNDVRLVSIFQARGDE